MWEKLKLFLWVATTGGATASVGILAFIGMYFMFPSLLLCIGAFLLAAAWEGQVNSEGIWGALERLFDPEHLQLAIAEKYLDDLDEAEHRDNPFYKKYKARKGYIQRIEKYIDELNQLKKHYLKAYDADRLREIEAEISEQKKELENERQGLRRQKLFFLKKNIFSVIIPINY